MSKSTSKQNNTTSSQPAKSARKARTTAKQAAEQANVMTVAAALTLHVKTETALDGLAKKMQEKKAGLSNAMLLAAKGYYVAAGTDAKIEVIARGDKVLEPKALHVFLTACTQEEDKYKERTKKAIPRTWSQAKSNIKAAWLKGLDLSIYDNESTMREDLNKLRRAERTASDASASSERVNEAQAIEHVIDTIVPRETVVELVQGLADDTLASLAGQLVELSNDMTATQKIALENELGGIILKYREILNKVLPITPEAPAKQA